MTHISMRRGVTTAKEHRKGRRGNDEGDPNVTGGRRILENETDRIQGYIQRKGTRENVEEAALCEKIRKKIRGTVLRGKGWKKKLKKKEREGRGGEKYTSEKS